MSKERLGAFGRALDRKLRKWMMILIVVLAAAVAVLVALRVNEHRKKPEAQVLTVSTLTDMIPVSDLSTVTSTYNGVAEVMNEKNPDKLDYYVAYEAKVQAGVDFADLQPEIDEASKTVTIRVPDAYYMDADVDMASLDFMFNSKKANTSGVTERAYKACQEDADRECGSSEAILELARENAVNAVEALTRPLIEQLYPEYTLVVE